MDERAEAVARFRAALSDGAEEQALDEALWDALIALQGETFSTAKGLAYTYLIRERRDGAMSGEMFISRKEKSITQSTVFMAFHKALELGGEVVGPKKLGTFGASYLYPVFIRLGVIREPAPVQTSLF